MRTILNEIDRLLSQLEQDPHLPSNKEVDEGVREVLEHLKGFVGNRRENGKGDSPDAPKIVSEGLDAAAKDAVCMAFGGDPAYYGNKAEFSVNECMRLFIAGTEWQKGQMMKDAVEGEIGYWNQRGLSILLDKSLEKLGYDEGTKVKIIIINDKEGDG